MRSNNQAFVNQILIYTLVTICFSGSIGLGTVWMRHQISVVANSNRVLESRLAELDRHLREGAAMVEAQQDSASLMQLNRDLKLNLVPPAMGRATRVKDDPVLRLAEKHNRGLFNDAPMSVRFNLTAGRTEAKAPDRVLSGFVSAPFTQRFAAKD